MDRNLTNSWETDNTNKEARKQSQPSLKLLVFSVGKLNLGLPIELVTKVISHTPVYSSGLNHMGIAHVDNQEMTIVDLHHRLFQVSLTNDASQYGYVIITKNRAGESFGIPLAVTPNLMAIPLDRIRVLPESYRRADTLEIASHVAVIGLEEQSMTIFVLDVERLLN